MDIDLQKSYDSLQDFLDVIAKVPWWSYIYMPQSKLDYYYTPYPDVNEEIKQSRTQRRPVVPRGMWRKGKDQKFSWGICSFDYVDFGSGIQKTHVPSNKVINCVINHLEIEGDITYD